MSGEGRRVVGLVTWRCEACNRVLCEYVPVSGLVLRKKCDRCDHWNDLEISDAA